MTHLTTHCLWTSSQYPLALPCPTPACSTSLAPFHDHCRSDNSQKSVISHICSLPTMSFRLSHPFPCCQIPLIKCKCPQSKSISHFDLLPQIFIWPHSSHIRNYIDGSIHTDQVTYWTNHLPPKLVLLPQNKNLHGANVLTKIWGSFWTPCNFSLI